MSMGAIILETGLKAKWEKAYQHHPEHIIL